MKRKTLPRSGMNGRQRLPAKSTWGILPSDSIVTRYHHQALPNIDVIQISSVSPVYRINWHAKLNGACKSMKFVQFSKPPTLEMINYENSFRARPIAEVMDASEEDYQPRGGSDIFRKLQHQGIEPQIHVAQVESKHRKVGEKMGKGMKIWQSCRLSQVLDQFFRLGVIMRLIS